MQPIIETDRLILRQFLLDDYKAVYTFSSNKEVQKYTGDALLAYPEEAKNIIKHVWYKDYEKHGYGRWAVIYKPDNNLIGFAGLKYLPEFNETDIGFRFLPEYWGKGLATEASEEIITYGFNKLHLNRIIGIALPENIGSCKVLTKIGMSFYNKDDYDGDGGVYNWYKIENN